MIEKVMEYWNSNPCGSKESNKIDRTDYFREIEEKRYRKESHIPIVAGFGDFKGKNILEIGCGMGIDGSQFAKAGALYTGIDLGEENIKLAKELFCLFGLKGVFFCADGAKLQFPDSSFDYVYSFGVIHHSPNTEKIVDEIYRVLKPGGKVCAMVYNKISINYFVEIMFLRKIVRKLLVFKMILPFWSKALSIDKDKLEKHREIYLTKPHMSREEWLSINTDGPLNPLSKVYTKEDAFVLFKKFKNMKTEVHFFDKSHWPIVNKFMPKALVQYLGKKWGWHRIVYAEKPSI